MQVFHITETRAIVPITRKLASLRYTLEDLVGPTIEEMEDEQSEVKGRRLSSRRLAQLIPNAELQCQKARKDLLQLILTYEARIRVPEIMVRERRYRTITYTASSDIYWQPETGICFITDLPRRALNAVTWMLSAAVLGYPGRLTPYDFDIVRMKHAIRYLTRPSNGGPGEIVRAIFRDVQINGNQMDEVNLRAHDLHKLDLFQNAEKGADQIYAIGFISPIIEGIGRPLACRIDARGSVLVYSQRLSESELQALFNYFEKMLKR